MIHSDGDRIGRPANQNTESIRKRGESKLDRANPTAIPNLQTSRDLSGGNGVAADYRALKAGAGVRLCAERTFIRISGDDRRSFLHGMCSNDIKGLEAGSLVAVLFLTERAHLIAEAIVWATADALL